MREPTNGDRYNWLILRSTGATELGPWVLVLRGYVAMAVRETDGVVIPWHNIVSIGDLLPQPEPVVTPDPWKEAGGE